MSWFSRIFGGGKKEGGTPMTAPASGVKTAKDLICGMDVEPEKAAATSLYQGQTYYFCAPECKKAFDADPSKYVQGAGQAGADVQGH